MRRAVVFIVLALLGATAAFAQAAPTATPEAAAPASPETQPRPGVVDAPSPADAPTPAEAAFGEAAGVKVAPGSAVPIDPRFDVGQPVPANAVDTELGLGWALLQTMVVLGVVVALAWLTLNVGLRKLLGIRPVSRGPPLVTVLERVPLDQKRALFVVRVANEVMLMGGGDGALSLLAKLDAAEVEKLRPETAQGPVQLSPLLQKLLGRKDAPPPPPAAPRSGEERT